MGTTKAPYAGVALDAENVYAATNGPGFDEPTLVRVPRAGGSATAVWTSGSVAWVTAHDGVVYFMARDGGDGSLMRVETDGAPAFISQVDLGFEQGAGLFALDDATAYVLAAGSSVVAVPLDGSPQKTVATGLVDPRSIAADESGIYVSTGATADGSTAPQILRLREGEAPVVLAELEKGLVFQLVLDETTVYWTGLGHVGHVGKCVR